MPKLNPLVKFDKDVAEFFLGHSPGRPTISRRAGRHISNTFGLDEETGTDLFHLGLFVVGAALLLKQAANQSTGEPVPQPSTEPINPLSIPGKLDVNALFPPKR